MAVADAVDVAVAVSVPLVVAVTDDVTVAVPVTLPDAVGDSVRVGVAVGESVKVAVSVTVAVSVSVPDSVLVAVSVRVSVPDRVAVLVIVPVGLSVEVIVCVGLSVSVSVTVGLEATWWQSGPTTTWSGEHDAQLMVAELQMLMPLATPAFTTTENVMRTNVACGTVPRFTLTDEPEHATGVPFTLHEFVTSVTLGSIESNTVTPFAGAPPLL